MKYEVTCNGMVSKKSNSRIDCEAFISMQKRKSKGAGLVSEGSANPNPAYAATCAWAIRKGADR